MSAQALSCPCGRCDDCWKNAGCPAVWPLPRPCDLDVSLCQRHGRRECDTCISYGEEAIGALGGVIVGPTAAQMSRVFERFVRWGNVTRRDVVWNATEGSEPREVKARLFLAWVRELELEDGHGG